MCRHLFVYNFPKGLLSDILDQFGIEKAKVQLVVGGVSEEIIKELLNTGMIPFVISAEIAEANEFRVAPKS